MLESTLDTPLTRSSLVASLVCKPTVRALRSVSHRELSRRSGAKETHSNLHAAGLALRSGRAGLGRRPGLILR